MEILSEGVPMTNREVFAVVRRRRDERSALNALPFFLSAAAPAPALSNFEVKKNRNAANAKRRNNNHNSNPNNEETIPISSHLTILMTEVNVLRYLLSQNHNNNNNNHELYGPSSVCLLEEDSDSEETEIKKEEEEDTNNSKRKKKASPPKKKAKKVEDDEDALPLLQRQLKANHLPGSPDHFHIVTEILSYYEKRGKEMEAQRLEALVALVESLNHNHHHPKIKKVKSEKMENTENNVPNPILHPPSLLLPSLPTEESSPHQNSFFLTAEEFCSLLNHEPKHTLAVYRCIYKLEERGTEETIGNFVTEVIKIFT